MSYWVVKLHQYGPEPRAITKFAGPFSTKEEAEKKAQEVQWEQLRRPTKSDSWQDAYLPDPKVEVWTDEQIALARAGGRHIY